MKGGDAIWIYYDEIQEENSKTPKEKVQTTYEGMSIRWHGFSAAALKEDNEVVFLEYWRKRT